jgi:hypothetical protein
MKNLTAYLTGLDRLHSDLIELTNSLEFSIDNDNSVNRAIRLTIGETQRIQGIQKIQVSPHIQFDADAIELRSELENLSRLMQPDERRHFEEYLAMLDSYLNDYGNLSHL